MHRSLPRAGLRNTPRIPHAPQLRSPRDILTGSFPLGIINWLVYGEWDKREASSSTSPAIPSRDATSRAVTAGDALSLSAVYRAVGINSAAVVQLSVDVHRGDDRIETPSFIRRPDLDSTLTAFLEETVNSLALRGNAYWLITRDSQRRVTNLKVLNPLDVVINTDMGGRVVGYQYGNRHTPYKPDEIQHLKLMRVPGSHYGLGPIQAAQIELRGAMDTRDYASNWFEQSGVPSGVLKTDQHLTPELATTAKDDWHSTPAGQVRVLGQGLDYKSIYLTPREAQFLESQQFTTTQIARLFGIPANLMLAGVDGNSMTYQNVSQSWTEYARFTFAKYVREIEEAFSALLPRGTRATFNLEALLRPDVVTRYDMHSQALSAGWLTVNDVRRIEGLPPIEGGDELKDAA